MTNSKIDRIEKEMQKTREKISEYQNRLKELAAQKTEAENLQIIALVRSMRVTPAELTALLSGEPIPGIAAAGTDYMEQEEMLKLMDIQLVVKQEHLNLLLVIKKLVMLHHMLLYLQLKIQKLYYY